MLARILVPDQRTEAFATELFRAAEPPDAIAAMSDELALGALRAAGPAGLTTLAQSLRDQGSRCARLVPGHREPPGQDQPHWEVIPRSTTRPQPT